MEVQYNISIIIPVYKVEKYIEECLDSIFPQLPHSVEIIIINDGSPDRSVDIIKSRYKDWLDKDQVVLLEQNNAGPGAARNSGLSVARGEYIGFLDSDDVLLENYFKVLVEVLKTYKVDIIEFGFKRFHEHSDLQKVSYHPLYTFEGLHQIEEVRNEIFSVGTWFPSTRVYKKEIFGKIRFPVGVFYEDLMTIPHIYFQDYSVYFIDQPLIGYRFNPDSTTALHTKEHWIDMYKFYMALKEFESTIAIDILKIKIARTLVYFYNELAPLDVPINNVIEDIKRIKKRWLLLESLQFPDLLFFTLPKLYRLIDKIRLRNRKSKI